MTPVKELVLYVSLSLIFTLLESHMANQELSHITHMSLLLFFCPMGTIVNIDICNSYWKGNNWAWCFSIMKDYGDVQYIGLIFRINVITL